MAIIIELPAPIQQQLEEAWNGEMNRKALEAVVVEGYRQEIFSRGQVSEILGLGFSDTEAFLKERNAYLHYDMDDLEKDVAALRRALSK